MGYSGNYTGYSVTGFDVFLWILLTAGSVGFPVIVMTICCIKIHQLDYKKKGIVGPYVSQNCLDKPEIKNLEVIEPSDIENLHNNHNMETSKNVHVRFKDDPNNNKGYIDLNTSRDVSENPASLRNLKDAFNNFSNRRPSKRDNKQSNLPTMTIDDQDDNVYSITKSFNQNNDYAYDGQQLQQPQQQQPRQSFENLYSQVRVQPNRAANNMYGNNEVVSEEMINPGVNEDYNNQQPVYMNTSYDDYSQQQQSNSQRNNSKLNRLI